jgi:hypothetical protein
MILLNTEIRYLITSIKNTTQFIFEVQDGDKLYSGKLTKHMEQKKIHQVWAGLAFAN